MFNLIIQILNIAAIVYFGRAIYRKQKAATEPVNYMATYFRCIGGSVSYGSVGVDVRGGITIKNFEEVVKTVRDRSGFQDAFVMSFSRYEPAEEAHAH